MKRVISLCLCAALLLCAGCGLTARQGGRNRYETTDLTLFDTVTTIVGYADSEKAFRQTARTVLDELREYHRLYDIYNSYDGLNNLKTVNDNAGGDPVRVDRRILALLLYARDLCEKTGGRVDVTYGAVLRLWHAAREAGAEDPAHAALPDEAALAQAALHTGFELLEIDEAASTVRLTDPEASLDVGAIAKGYATQQVCAHAPSGLLVSVGGNVFATGPRPDGGDWIIGIENPDGGDYLRTVRLSRGAVVCSGDYQRYYLVDGVAYHHIIDPATRFPGTKWRMVTVLCPDSGLADGLSTALFLMTEAEGRALLADWGAEAMWVSPDGTITCTDGFRSRIKN